MNEKFCALPLIAVHVLRLWDVLRVSKRCLFISLRSKTFVGIAPHAHPQETEYERPSADCVDAACGRPQGCGCRLPKITRHRESCPRPAESALGCAARCSTCQYVKGGDVCVEGVLQNAEEKMRVALAHRMEASTSYNRHGAVATQRVAEDVDPVAAAPMRCSSVVGWRTTLTMLASSRSHSFQHTQRKSAHR